MGPFLGFVFADYPFLLLEDNITPSFAFAKIKCDANPNCGGITKRADEMFETRRGPFLDVAIDGESSWLKPTVSGDSLTCIPTGFSTLFYYRGRLNIAEKNFRKQFGDIGQFRFKINHNLKTFSTLHLGDSILKYDVIHDALKVNCY